MAKALVIKGANFSTNKVATIEFDEEIPCTGITLSDSALTPSYLGTDTITATVTPANTTDEVQWSTSNQNVVTVENGAITAVGIGSATVTATCGNFSATCAIAVTSPALSGTEIVGARIEGVGTKDGGGGLGYLLSAAKYGTIANENGIYRLYEYSGSIQGEYYPMPMPNNTAKIRVTANSSAFFKTRFGLYNLNTAVPSYPTIANLLQLVEIRFADNIAELTIPTYDGGPIVDGFVISFEKTSAFASGDFESVTVEFVAAE